MALMWAALAVLVVRFSPSLVRGARALPAGVESRFPEPVRRVREAATEAARRLRLLAGLARPYCSTRRAALRACQVASLAVAVALLAAWSTRTENGAWIAGLAKQMQQRLADRVAELAIGWRIGTADDAFVAAYDDLFGAIGFIRERTEPGEWVYSNIVSDNQFWFLSKGRYSVLEGSAMYQVYSLQRRAARRIEQFRKVAQTGDTGPLEAYEKLRYLLIFKRDNCSYPACFGFNVFPAINLMGAGRPDLERVYENPHFVVYSWDRSAGRNSPP
jgi:hypothetical protein